MSNNVHQAKSFSTTTSLPPLEDGAGQLRLDLNENKSIGHGGVHDVGGLSSLLGQPIDLTDPALSAWEQQTHALLLILVKNGFFTTDELRRNVESMQDDHYIMRSYYCKWATSMALGLIERGVITYSELDKELLGAYDPDSSKKRVDPEKPKYSVGDSVRVMPEQSLARWRKPHLRTPGYIFGVQGVVVSYEGYFPDPSYKAFRSMMLAKSNVGAAVTDDLERKEHLYRIQFRQEDVWPEGKKLAGGQNTAHYDTVDVEIYENWLLDDTLEAAKAGTWEMDPSETVMDSVSPTKGHHDNGHGHDHNHDHEEDHTHLSRPDLEQRAVDLELTSRLCSSGSIETEMGPTLVIGDRLSAALIALMSQPNRLGEDLHNQLRQTIDAVESTKIRADGAALVVRAWIDPQFEKRLLEDAASAAWELGINATNATAPTKLKVVKSEMPTATQPGVHNIITCTLCSCYPLSLLGLSPKWYKSRSYRARTVREPRAMLSDSFGLTLKPEEWTIRVHDSTADLRYLVLPPRPPNTEGWSEEELRKLVTRDTMIGVALPDGCV